MPCDYKKYPVNWHEIRETILARAGNKCELCGAENHQPHPVTGSMVILTIAHIDQDRKNNKPWNLLALCQRCHLKIDLPFKMRGRIQRMEGKQFKSYMEGKHFESFITDDMIKPETEPTQEQTREYLDNRLINGMAGEIVEKVKEYLKKNNIEEQGVEVNIEIEKDQKNPFLIEVKTTIYKKVI